MSTLVNSILTRVRCLLGSGVQDYAEDRINGLLNELKWLTGRLDQEQAYSLKIKKLSDTQLDRIKILEEMLEARQETNAALNKYIETIGLQSLKDRQEI